MMEPSQNRTSYGAESKQDNLFALIHLANQVIDKLLAVTGVSSNDEMLEFASTEAAIWGGKLEWANELVGSLESRADGEDFVDKIFNANNPKMAESCFNQLVICESNTLLINAAMTALINQFLDRLQVGIAIGNIWLNQVEHFLGRCRKAYENPIVDLDEAEELQDLARLWRKLVNTTK